MTTQLAHMHSSYLLLVTPLPRRHIGYF